MHCTSIMMQMSMSRRSAQFWTAGDALQRRITAQHCAPSSVLYLCIMNTYKATMLQSELSVDVNYMQQRGSAHSAAGLTRATLRWLGSVAAALWRFPADVLKLDVDVDLPLAVALYWLKDYMT